MQFLAEIRAKGLLQHSGNGAQGIWSRVLKAKASAEMVTAWRDVSTGHRGRCPGG